MRALTWIAAVGFFGVVATTVVSWASVLPVALEQNVDVRGAVVALVRRGWLIGAVDLIVWALGYFLLLRFVYWWSAGGRRRAGEPL